VAQRREELPKHNSIAFIISESGATLRFKALNTPLYVPFNDNSTK
jgi:hypothetical protein